MPLPTQRYISIIATIVVCAATFVLQQANNETIVADYAAIPTVIHQSWSAITSGSAAAADFGELLRLLTAAFLHADFEHILYNMIFLWTFAVVVSESLGQWAAVALFMICSIAGNVAQVALNVESPIPILGASGGISGLEGVYLGLALRWQLPDPDVWPLAYPIPPLQLAAFAVVGFLFDAYALMNHHQDIAYGAHAGGFLSGVLLAILVTSLFATSGDYKRRTRQ